MRPRRFLTLRRCFALALLPLWAAGVAVLVAELYRYAAEVASQNEAGAMVLGPAVVVFGGVLLVSLWRVIRAALKG